MRTTIGIMYSTCVTHNNKRYKVIIDRDSYVNLIIKLAIEEIGLKVERPQQPYVTWVDNCLFSFRATLSMNVSHILLGRLRLYNLNVNSFEKSNTYTFMYDRSIGPFTVQKSI